MLLVPKAMVPLLSDAAGAKSNGAAAVTSQTHIANHIANHTSITTACSNHNMNKQALKHARKTAST